MPLFRGVFILPSFGCDKLLYWLLYKYVSILSITGKKQAKQNMYICTPFNVGFVLM